MSESYIQNLFADRIGGKQYGKSTAIYKFEKIKRAKRAAPAANPGAEIIDMGVGEPDEMAFPEVVAELHNAASMRRWCSTGLLLLIAARPATTKVAESVLNAAFTVGMNASAPPSPTGACR